MLFMKDLYELFILNDYESPYSLLVEQAHQITFHQQLINYDRNL